jgi:hypothetical protein
VGSEARVGVLLSQRCCSVRRGKTNKGINLTRSKPGFFFLPLLELLFFSVLMDLWRVKKRILDKKYQFPLLFNLFRDLLQYANDGFVIIKALFQTASYIVHNLTL